MSTRICRTLPYGATIQQAHGPLWTKVGERVWEESRDGEQRDNAALDMLLASGRAEVVRQQVQLDTEQVPAFEVEAGEYVVLPFGFWMEGIPDDERLVNQDERVAEQLWRVAGWSNNLPGTECLMLDAPVNVMSWTSHLMEPDGDWEVQPVYLPVGAEDVLRVVAAGQEHEDWSGQWDWELWYGPFGEAPTVSS